MLLKSFFNKEQPELADMSGFAQSLRDAGYRLTKPRLAVIQVLEENAEGLSPEEIHMRGRGFYARLGLVPRSAGMTLHGWIR